MTDLQLLSHGWLGDKNGIQLVKPCPSYPHKFCFGGSLLQHGVIPERRLVKKTASSVGGGGSDGCSNFMFYTVHCPV